MSSSAEGRRYPCSEFGVRSLIRTAKGFTLLEVLLAMAILAVLSTVIFGTFSNSSRDIQLAEQSRDDTDLARTLISRLSDDIGNAFCSPNVKGTFFYGKDNEAETEGGAKVRQDTLSLTTLTNWRKPDSAENELWEVGYFFREKPDGKGFILYRREKRELDNDVPPMDGGAEYELTDRVEQLRLRYFDGSKLVENWDRKTGCTGINLPQAIEISVILEGGKVYVTQILREKLTAS